MTALVSKEDPGGRLSDHFEPPHPDKKPWRKACAVCAFRRSNPQEMSEGDFDDLYLQESFGGFSFICAHRTEDGCYRECACWAAIQKTRRAAVSELP